MLVFSFSKERLYFSLLDFTAIRVLMRSSSFLAETRPEIRAVLAIYASIMEGTKGPFEQVTVVFPNSEVFHLYGTNLEYSKKAQKR